jgi:RNA polymerase sigma-70 factor (ECF subfamily)
MAVLGYRRRPANMEASARNITELLVAWGNGDEQALNVLAPLVHDELHRLAAHYMAGERSGHVLQATALVNEAYLRLVDWQHVQWDSRGHFFGIASHLMRRILVDVARQQLRAKRGGRRLHLSLSEADHIAIGKQPDLVALDDALTTLEVLDKRQSQVVELRFFGGLSLEETATVLKVSVGTVRRDWTLARAWLFRELNNRGR